ncbi:hypothetical protein VZC37_15960 [Gordonia sp. LSe1-13]|uniref:Uncharacterized protein n=1 Tax=Gordonia sesuvii TaxID=3116777 RepID=A0ABU7MFE0_9ACTN|nr:hypothetical protein [Gordonia sp. LSe1-13]
MTPYRRQLLATYLRMHLLGAGLNERAEQQVSTLQELHQRASAEAFT